MLAKTVIARREPQEMEYVDATGKLSKRPER